MLNKIDLWRQMSEGELDEWYMPDDIYDLLYSHTDHNNTIALIRYISLENVTPDYHRIFLLKLYLAPILGINLLDELRIENNDYSRRHKRDIAIYAKELGRSELELIEEYNHDEIEEEERYEAVEMWPKNFTNYLDALYDGITDIVIKDKIIEYVDNLHEDYEENWKRPDRQRSRFATGPNLSLTPKNINSVILTDTELNLILKIHHAVLKDTIDVSYIVDKDDINSLMQIVSHL
jgi:hypothetical protein